MLISELEDLDDILDSLIFEDEPSIFNDIYAVELVETALHLMDEYINLHPHVISEPDFHDILIEEIKDLFYIQLEEQIETLNNGNDIEDDMNELLEDAFIIFVSTFYPDKLQNHKYDISEYDSEEIDLIEEKIQKLREIPQPEQRTPEWYQFRWNLITASNAWKAFESQSTINQLIYEKCQPLKSNGDDEEGLVKMVNVNTPLHWGQKYEPLSVLIYEQNYCTKVEDFGCIKHPNYAFLGASPDGINVNKESHLYGRMLEIKNVVSREINGIPKKEYWTQMQLQMEVCDLDECDFLETKFIEYPDYNSYKNDIEGKMKGIFIHFHAKNGKPFYSYKPLDIINQEDINIWEGNTLSLYQSEPYNYTYMKFIYWKLDKLSCVLVVRNVEWFKNNIAQLERVWKTIEKERISGYEHRAPVRKTKKEKPKK
jgi:putative phage-type endonuclease